MNWSQFITQLLEQELKLSSAEAERLTGIRQPVFDRWKSGKVGKPHRSTLRKLEAGLNISINDSDPEDIQFVIKSGRAISQILKDKISPTNEIKISSFNTSIDVREYSLPLTATVPAGQGSLNEIDSMALISIDSRRQFAIQVDKENGDSMQPFLKPGDIVICDSSAAVVTGDIVAARWDDSHAAIKILGDNTYAPGSYLLYSYNPVIKPIIVKKETTRLYKVVLVSKQS